MRGLIVAACVVTLAGCAVPTSTATPSSAQLASHKYWEVPMTAAKIDAIVDRVVKADKGGLIFIDEKAAVTEHPADKSMLERVLLRDFGTGRRVVFDMNDYKARPSRDQILADFARKLDEEEFKPKADRTREKKQEDDAKRWADEMEKNKQP